jgi:hypothetical protein
MTVHFVGVNGQLASGLAEEQAGVMAGAVLNPPTS